MLVRNRYFQLAIGITSLVMLILSILMIPKNIIPSSIPQNIWVMLTIMFALNLIEVIVYFLFAKTATTRMICWWLNVFVVSILILSVTGGFIYAALNTMFAPFLEISGWFSFVLVLLSYALIATMICFLVFSKKEEKALKEQQEE